MSDTKNLNHNRKKDFLSKEVEHIDITSFDSRVKRCNINMLNLFT